MCIYVHDFKAQRFEIALVSHRVQSESTIWARVEWDAGSNQKPLSTLLSKFQAAPHTMLPLDTCELSVRPKSKQKCVRNVTLTLWDVTYWWIIGLWVFLNHEYRLMVLYLDLYKYRFALKKCINPGFLWMYLIPPLMNGWVGREEGCGQCSGAGPLGPSSNGAILTSAPRLRIHTKWPRAFIRHTSTSNFTFVST